MHKSRVFCVGDGESPEELAKKLTGTTWTLCTGFSLGSYLFLNDSTSEDGGQEYAVVKRLDKENVVFVQLESITFGWCDYEKGFKFIQRILAGEFDAEGQELSRLSLEKAQDHQRCRHCA